MGIPGMDYLGGARYPKVILKYHPKGWAGGFLLECDGFGESYDLISEFSARSLGMANRAHCGWSDKHEFPTRTFSTLAARAARYNKIAKKYPDIEWFVSGALEHKLDSGDAKKLADEIKSAAPNCRYVNCPMPGGAILAGEVNEVHGYTSKLPSKDSIVSWDGLPCVDADFVTWKTRTTGALIQYVWDVRLNGHWEMPDEENPAVPRAKRRGWPDREYLASLQYYWNEKGAVKRLPTRTLYKSHAENEDGKDYRAEHPCFITTVKVDVITIHAMTHQKVGTLSPFDPSGRRWPPMLSSPWSRTHPGHRYYTSSWGYELAEKARALSGQPLCYLKAGNTKFGPINPAMREGFYRNK